MWKNSSSTLVLLFTATSTLGPSSEVTLTAYPNASYFDLSYRLVSPPTNGSGYFWLLFPSEVLFDTIGLRALHLPILPGVALNASFFEQQRVSQWSYPGLGGFAGWTHIDGVNGSLAIYDLSGPDAVAPYTTSPRQTSGPTHSPSEWFLAVYHYVNVTAGCSPTNAAGPAPPCALGVNGTLTRRFVVAPASAPLSALQTIAAYALDNGMVSAPPWAADPAHTTATTTTAWPTPVYPTLRDKLNISGGPDFWRQVYQAPLMKLDAVAISKRFDNYSTQVGWSVLYSDKHAFNFSARLLY